MNSSELNNFPAAQVEREIAAQFKVWLEENDYSEEHLPALAPAITEFNEVGRGDSDQPSDEPPVETTQAKSARIRDSEKLTEFLARQAEETLKASPGLKLSLLINHLLVLNAEYGDPRLPKNTVSLIASQAVIRSSANSSHSKGSGKSARQKDDGFHSGEEWFDLDFTVNAKNVVIGTPTKVIVEPFTKNIIQGPEKAFKTTFLKRLLAGGSKGTTLFPELPFLREHFVIYVHGELSNRQIKSRFVSATQELPRPMSNFHQGRNLKAHLIEEQGQEVLRGIIERRLKSAPPGMPVILVLDPWQSFIARHDENDFVAVSTATSFIDQLIEDYNLTVFLVFHQGKDPSKGVRGHSSIAGWRDALIRLTPVNNNRSVRVEVMPRWDGPLDPFVVTFRDGTVWPDNSKPAWGGRTGQIRLFVQSKGGWATRQDVTAHLKTLDPNITVEAIRKAIERALRDKAVERGNNDDLLVPDASTTPSDPGPQNGTQDSNRNKPKGKS